MELGKHEIEFDAFVRNKSNYEGRIYDPISKNDIQQT